MEENKKEIEIICQGSGYLQIHLLELIQTQLWGHGEVCGVYNGVEEVKVTCVFLFPHLAPLLLS